MVVVKQWVFQQGTAPAQQAKTKQLLLEANLPGFIAAKNRSPDLHPWNVFEENACFKPRTNIELLKADLMSAAALIPPVYCPGTTFSVNFRNV